MRRITFISDTKCFAFSFAYKNNLWFKKKNIHRQTVILKFPFGLHTMANFYLWDVRLSIDTKLFQLYSNAGQWGFSLYGPLSLFSFFHYQSKESFPTQRATSDMPSDSFYVNIHLPLSVSIKKSAILAHVKNIQKTRHPMYRTERIQSWLKRRSYYRSFSLLIYSRNPLNTLSFVNKKTNAIIHIYL